MAITVGSEVLTQGHPHPSTGAEGSARLPPEPASGRGRKHGTSSRQPFDRWFRYPAGFASDYVARLLGRLTLDPGQLLLDCFAGSGVTGTAAQTAGYRFVGIEAHPLVAELASLKLAILPADSPRHAGLSHAATTVVEHARNRVTDIPKAGQDEPDLVRRSFLPEQLQELIALRETIKELGGDVWAPYLKWALLGVLRDVAVVKVGWPYQRPGSARQPPHSDPSERFLARAAMIAEDLASHGDAGASLPSARMICGDARDHAAWACIPEGSAGGCVASPPYLNNFDYADATRLELYFWGEVTSWRDMCLNVRAGMIIATTQQSSVGASRQALDVLTGMGEVGKRVRELTKQLARERNARTRGKEYDRVLPDYFVGISQVLTHLWGALAPSARCVWLVGDSAPYGVYVDTPRLIGELAEHAGFRVVDDVVLRRRGGRWQTNTGRHSTALSERLLLFDRVAIAQPPRSAGYNSATWRLS